VTSPQRAPGILVSWRLDAFARRSLPATIAEDRLATRRFFLIPPCLVFARLLFLFVAIPLLELVFLILLKEATNWTFTLLVVLATGTLGAYLTRQQGLIAFRRIREDAARGRLPTAAALDAVMILIAGAMLLTPGVLTDIAGLSLLFPPVRRRYKAWLVDWLKSRFRVASPASGGGPIVIDSYVVESERSDKRDDSSPP
jgi:UPF0716 protein FxsA